MSPDRSNSHFSGSQPSQRFHPYQYLSQNRQSPAQSPDYGYQNQPQYAQSYHGFNPGFTLHNPVPEQSPQAPPQPPQTWGEKEGPLYHQQRASYHQQQTIYYEQSASSHQRLVSYHQQQATEHQRLASHHQQQASAQNQHASYHEEEAAEHHRQATYHFVFQQQQLCQIQQPVQQQHQQFFQPQQYPQLQPEPCTQYAQPQEQENLSYAQQQRHAGPDVQQQPHTPQTGPPPNSHQPNPEQRQPSEQRTPTPDLIGSRVEELPPDETPCPSYAIRLADQVIEPNASEERCSRESFVATANAILRKFAPQDLEHLTADDLRSLEEGELNHLLGVVQDAIRRS